MNRLKLCGRIEAIDENNCFSLILEDKTSIRCKLSEKLSLDKDQLSLDTYAWVLVAGYFLSEDVSCEFVCDACGTINSVKAIDSYMIVTSIAQAEEPVLQNTAMVAGFVKQEPREIPLHGTTIYQARIKVPKYRTYIAINSVRPMPPVKKNDFVTVSGSLRSTGYTKRCLCSTCKKELIKERLSLSVTAQVIRKETEDEGLGISGQNI